MGFPAMTGTLSIDELHVRVQRFYAEQMRLLDTGATGEWAATFTEDGTFSVPTLAEPVRGRAAIASGARAAAGQRAAAGVVHRHWMGMLTVEPREDGTVHARSYALVIETPLGDLPRLHRSTVCEDVLVPSGDTWRVRERVVTRDDLPAG
ncbi:nuclear transport factor 2 family protein [Sphaerisporangium perillae]|uniref:nuclear transport factor 2 family protein n=1 Tax=Sphaerisporangium perillae TaxID=2935860 RepID=UPI00200EB923|nr:nuclear transport factor 2 family protein [Sphaerisporangium perillae]